MLTFKVEYDDLPQIVQECLQVQEYDIAKEYLIAMLDYVEGLDTDKELN